jgi:hypothetical protein
MKKLIKWWLDISIASWIGCGIVGMFHWPVKLLFVDFEWIYWIIGLSAMLSIWVTLRK